MQTIRFALGGLNLSLELPDDVPPAVLSITVGMHFDGRATGEQFADFVASIDGDPELAPGWASAPLVAFADVREDGAAANLYAYAPLDRPPEPRPEPQAMRLARERRLAAGRAA